MKLERLLAQNMLRFGTKNLSAALKQKLTEQVTNPKSSPLYNIMYDKLGDKSRRYWDGVTPGSDGNKMTDSDKLALLNTFSEKVTNKERLTKKNQNQVLRLLNAVAIGSKPGEATQIQLAAPVAPKISEYTAVYPDNQNLNPELQNFFLTDNIVEVSPANINKFKLMIADLISVIPENENITGITVYAGSSTSQVPTTYGKGAYKTIAEGQQNNIALANARYDAIVTKLSELVKEQLPSFNGQIIIEPKSADTVKPNNSKGPVYTEKERAYYFSTGKLDPKLKTEYEAAYGPFKGSYGGVTLYTTGQNIKTTPPEKEVQVTATWNLRLDWKVTNTDRPTSSTGKKGGGIVYTGKNKTTCPFW